MDTKLSQQTHTHPGK